MKPLSILLASLCLAGCARKEEAASKPLVAVKAVRAEVAEIRVSVRAPATVFAREQANLSARVTAAIRELRARKGDTVKAGQIVAVLENGDILAQRAEARAALADARANLQKTTSGTLPTEVERARGQVAVNEAALNQAQKYYDRRADLFKQGAIPGRELLASQTDLAQAKTNLEVSKKALDLLVHQSRERDVQMAESRVTQAEARVAAAEAQLQFTELRSPFAGSITEQFMYPGDMAKPDAPVFTVMDLSTAIARAQVPETDASRVRAGQACAFEALDAAAPAAGRVTVVNRAVDPARRTVEVWCEIPNGGSRLRAGAFGNVAIVTGTISRAVVVPAAAVEFSEGTRSGHVYVVKNGNTAHKVEVEAGETAGGRVEIRKGVQPGDVVIVEGGYGLPDGTPVQLPEAK